MSARRRFLPAAAAFSVHGRNAQATPGPKRVGTVTAANNVAGEDIERQQQLDRLQVELDQTRAWCAGLEGQVAELRALLAFLGAGVR